MLWLYHGSIIQFRSCQIYLSSNQTLNLIIFNPWNYAFLHLVNTSDLKTQNIKHCNIPVSLVKVWSISFFYKNSVRKYLYRVPIKFNSSHATFERSYWLTGRQNSSLDKIISFKHNCIGRKNLIEHLDLENLEELFICTNLISTAYCIVVSYVKFQSWYKLH